MQNSDSLMQESASVSSHFFQRFDRFCTEGNIPEALFSLIQALCNDPSKIDVNYSTFFILLDKWCQVEYQTSSDQGKGVLNILQVAKDLYPDTVDLNYLLAKYLYRMSLQVWKDLFRECLGNRSVQYYQEVVPLLLAVDQGIKPSLLWDVCTPDTNGLLNLVNEASNKNLFISKLTIIEIDLDVFVANLSSLCRILTGIITSNPTWLIDVTTSDAKVASKENHISFKNHIISIMTQLGFQTEGKDKEPQNSEASNSNFEQNSNPKTPEDKAILLQLPKDTNLSTIFGCLIGYPHIYWWQGDTGEQSLAGISLKVFKLSATCAIDNESVELFSFSIPESLEPDLRPGIEIWGNEVNVWIEQAQAFSDAKFKCDSVVCLSVSL